MVVGFDTLEFAVSISREKAIAKSETPPTYLDNGNKNRFLCQFFNYQARFEYGFLYFFGSIQKAIDGQNVNCNMGAQWAYIIKLFDFLQINPNAASVKRYDIATTIEIETPPNVAIKSFGELSGRRKRVIGDKIFSVYYDKHKVRETIKRGKVEEITNTILFYDKGFQAKTNGNLLRLEYRNMKPPQAANICLLFRNFEKYCKQIADELFKLKMNPINDIIMKANTKTELNAALTIYAIRAAEQANPNFITETLEKLKLTSGADKHEFWRFKRGICDRLKAQTTAADNSIIERLQTALMNV